MVTIDRHSVVEGDSLRVRCRGLGKTYRIYDSLWSRMADVLRGPGNSGAAGVEILCDINLELHRKQCIGVMGPNGAGKTTLLRILTGALLPTAGELEVVGRATLLDLGGGLRAELSGRENLVALATTIGLTPNEIEARLEEMIDFCELGRAIHAPVKTYSSGMAMRLAFSIYAHTDPDILIVDEAFAVGDARFVLKCSDRLRALAEAGTSIVLASHDASAIAEMCDSAIVLDRGRICFEGDPVLAADAYHTALGIASGRRRSWGEISKATAELSPTTVDEFLSSAILRSPLPDGSRDLDILGLRVTRNEQPSGGAFMVDDECQFEWLVRIARPIDCLTTGLHIHTPLGTYVSGTSYVHLGRPLHIEAPGHYVFAIRFPMRLAPGKYVVSLGAAEPDLHRHSIGGNQLDRFRSAYEFEVLDFELAPDEPVPFLGLIDLNAKALPPQRLGEDQ